MILLELPSELETRLSTEAQRLGETESRFIRQAIIAYLEDVEDAAIAARVGPISVA